VTADAIHICQLNEVLVELPNVTATQQLYLMSQKMGQFYSCR